MTDIVRDRLLHGATVLRARAARIARAYSPDMSIRDGDADALASFAEAVVEALAASPQGEGSSAEAPMEAVAWLEKVAEARGWIEDAECSRGCSSWRPDVHHRTHCDCGREDALQALAVSEPTPSAHPAPIKPSGDTGELRERVARIVDPAGFDDRWDVPGLRHEASLDERVDEALAKADAILDLIQSEMAG